MKSVETNQKNFAILGNLGIILAIFSFYAAMKGIFVEHIYNDLVHSGVLSETLVVGSIAQDIISLLLAISLFLISIFYLKQQSIKSMITIIGLAWYFFYAFGLYVIQGNYTSIYLVYLTIFGLSIYSIVWGIVGIHQTMQGKYEISKPLRIAVVVFLLLILFILVPGWFMRILPDISNRIPGQTYAVFILDLCVVFPAFAQIAYMLIKREYIADILAGIALIKVFTLCMSWGFAEWYIANKTGIDVQMDMAVIASVLTLFGIALTIPYFIQLKCINKTVRE